MSDNKERVYSEEDLCEYTILQKIDELEKQLKNIKSEVSSKYETKVDADTAHGAINGSIGLINQDLQNTKKDNNAFHELISNNLSSVNKDLQATKGTVNNLNKVTPTDVGVKDNKLGLLHDTTWLTNQDAINLDGFTYDEATKTLKVNVESIPVVEGTITGQSGTQFNQKINVTIPQAQTKNFILHIFDKENNINWYLFTNFQDGLYNAALEDEYNPDSAIHNIVIMCGSGTSMTINLIAINNNYFINSLKSNNKITIDAPMSSYFCQITDTDGQIYASYQMQNNLAEDFSYGYGAFDIDNNSISYLSNQETLNNEFKEYTIVIPKTKTISLFGKHSILVPKDSADANIDLYRHEISISDEKGSYAYLTYISSSNLVVDSITDMNTLLGTTARSISCTGIIIIDRAYNPIHAIAWTGTYSDSQVLVTDLNNGEDYQMIKTVFKLPTIEDVVTTI